ncbi:MAG TPA: hypothetical protein PKN48_10685 [Bacteroidales bacterium]|mgnify:CR=1 FL=1|nr:hypothetical protein [Bacteroidales bacterium]
MKKSILIIHWLPRILCILAILFVSIFALDAFDPGLTTGQQILGFIMHLIPSFLLIALLVVAWKWEYAGGIIYMVIGLSLSPLVFMINYRMNHSVCMSLGIIMALTIPFAIIGFLFILSHFLKKKNQTKKPLF